MNKNKIRSRITGADIVKHNIYDDNIFPTFSDLQNELVNTISESAYSEEVKSNYIGSLVTRIKSLRARQSSRVTKAVSLF